MLRPARVLDTLLDCAHRTVRKSLQPQDSRKVDTSCHPGIELEVNDLTFAAGSSEITERPFDVASRASLVAQEVVRDGNHPLPHQPIVRVRAGSRQGRELAGQGKGGVIFDAVDVKRPQAPERKHLVLGIGEAFRDL